MGLDIADEIMQRPAHLDEAVGELPQLILRGDCLRFVAQIAVVQEIARTNDLFNIDGKAVRHQEYDTRHEKKHHERQPCENAEETVCFLTNLTRRHLADHDPAAAVKLHRYEHCR